MTPDVTCTVKKWEDAPRISTLAFISGVPTEARAKAWGETHGYPLVYWSKRTQRIYYDKRKETK